MRPAGRAALLLGVLSIGNFVFASEYGVPVEIKLWDTGRTPLSHMVDVTNEFGLKVLAEHNFLNENNIAFSPYGLMGILVALYEGVDGESSYQIQKGMQLPWNRNVMRIGFRDIHRTLKTYFVPEEGFLAGLALNNENVTFNEGYKKILRFYGFDLDNDQLPTTPVNNETNASSTPSNGESAAATAAPVTAATGAASTLAREDLSSAAATTTNPNAETIGDLDIRMSTSSPTTANSAAPHSETTTSFSTLQTDTTTSATTADSLSTATTNIDRTNTEYVSENVQSTMIDSTTMVEIINATDIEVETAPSSSSTSESSTALTNEELETPSRSGQLSTTVTIDAATTSTQALESETTEQLITEAIDTTETIRTTENSESTVEIERRKKSVVNFIFTNPPYIHENVIYRGFDIPIPVQNNPNIGNDQMFLANGLKNVQVSYMQYDAVLEHAFLPHLEAAALRLPLDSERYYLLALLPARAHPAELARLLARLARHSDLRDVYAALRPRQVRATLPSFTVKGHVTLTADLQKLGIVEVFEPRQRDFAPMTPQAGVFVRSIEQAVSVAIRKYGADDRNASRYVNRPPVHFSATYPFLYFVMDASIHVALMAGKMVDPLNSRIL